MKKKTILVTGLHGYIGSRLVQMIGLSLDLLDLNREGKKYNSDRVSEVIRADVTNYQHVIKSVKDKKIDVVLHLAAKTHIDRCENDKKLGRNGEVWKVNVQGTKNIARLCQELDAFLIYLSTECVFDGRGGFYKEEDKQNPINWYGYTKYCGEQEVVGSGARYCILRSVLAYGHVVKSSYDLVRIIWEKLSNGDKFKVVNNQFLTITFIDDLVKVILLLIKNKPYGIYHYAGKNAWTPYGISNTLKDFFKIKKSAAIPGSLSNFFGERAKYRLVNASLSSEKIKKELNIAPSDFKTSLSILKSRFTLKKR